MSTVAFKTDHKRGSKGAGSNMNHSQAFYGSSLSCVECLVMGFGFVIGFTGLLKLGTTSDYKHMTNSLSLQFTVLHPPSLLSSLCTGW